MRMQFDTGRRGGAAMDIPMRTRLVLVPIAALVAWLVVGAGDARAADAAGAFVGVEGAVEVSRDGRTFVVKVGDPVHVGDEIHTGRPGQARVAFRDRSTINLGDDSTLVIDENVFSPDDGTFKSYMRLLKGRVRSLVTEYYGTDSASYEIETATAVSGVRGTEFVVSYDDVAARTDVIGLSGKIRVHGVDLRDQPGVLVSAGRFTRVARGSAPTLPQDVSPGQMRSFLDGLNLVTAPPGGMRLDNVDPVLSGKHVPRAEQPAPVPPVESGSPGQSPRTGDPAVDDPKTPADVVDQPIEELGEIGVNF